MNFKPYFLLASLVASCATTPSPKLVVPNIRIEKTISKDDYPYRQCKNKYVDDVLTEMNCYVEFDYDSFTGPRRSKKRVIATFEKGKLITRETSDLNPIENGDKFGDQESFFVYRNAQGKVIQTTRIVPNNGRSFLYLLAHEYNPSMGYEETLNPENLHLDMGNTPEVKSLEATLDDAGNVGHGRLIINPRGKRIEQWIENGIHLPTGRLIDTNVRLDRIKTSY